MRINRQSILEHIKSPLYRNSLFLMTTTVARAGLGFLFWIIVARFYTEAEVGLGSAIVSAMTFLGTLSLMGLGATIIRFLPKAEKPREMINSCLTLSGLIAIAAAAVFIAGLDIWSPALLFIRENVALALAFVFFVTTLALLPVVDSVFIAKRRAEFALFRVTTVLLLRLPLPILLVFFFHAFGIAASWGIAAAIAVAISLFFSIPQLQKGYKPVPSLNPGIISHMWRYSTGSYFAALFNTAPVYLLPLMVVNLLGAEQNAYFYVAWMIANLLFAVSLAVSQSLFAEGSHFREELWGNVGKSLKFVLLILVPAVILIVVLGKWVLLIFGAGYSANSLLLLRILCLSSLFIGINRVYATTLRVEDRIRELVVIYALLAMAVLVGSYLVIPLAGIVGIGYVWLAANGLVSIYAISVMGSRYRAARSGKSNTR
jgi:O-antigen/teichoic acid export membrane protein